MPIERYNLVNQKIFVIVAIVILAGILGTILSFGSSFITETPEKTSIEETPKNSAKQIQPITIELEDLTIFEVNPREATLEIKFKINNPNSNSMIVQVMDYQLFETNFSDKKQISGGQIGTRAGGMVEFGNNYYTLLSNNSIILKDKIILKNTGNTPELWSSIEKDSAKWRVTGVVYYNLSSMTSGQENELHFEFTK